MPLTWSVEKVKDWQEVCEVTVHDHRGDDVKRWNPVTEALVWMMMRTGIGHAITEKNAVEFYSRIKLIEAFDGPLIVLPEGPRWIEPQDVAAHIGMSSNASKMTRTQFVAKHVGYAFGDWEHRYKRTVG